MQECLLATPLATYRKPHQKNAYYKNAQDHVVLNFIMPHNKEVHQSSRCSSEAGNQDYCTMHISS